MRKIELVEMESSEKISIAPDWTSLIEKVISEKYQLIEQEFVKILKLSKRKIKMPASSYSLRWHGIEIHCKNANAFAGKNAFALNSEKIRVMQRGKQLGETFEIRINLENSSVTITRGVEF